MAERLRVRLSRSVERVVGQSGSLTKRRPRIVSSVGGVDAFVRPWMLSACCTQHTQSQSRPAAVGVTLFPNCRSCVVTPQGRRSTDPEETYVVFASGCGANSWRTLRTRGAAVGVDLTSSVGLSACWGLSACCGGVVFDDSSGSSTEQRSSAAHSSSAVGRTSDCPHHSGGDQVPLVPGARSSAGGGVCSCVGRSTGSATSIGGTGRGGDGGSGGSTSNSESGAGWAAR